MCRSLLWIVSRCWDRTAAADLSIGYFAQQQLEQLKPDCDAFWHLRSLGGLGFASGEEQKVRDHLGSFGFTGDRAFEPVGRFSGGEKARLTLAILVARRPNLLLLDEPTNHLDIEMRQALSVALQSFEGGLVVVSHDRHLIKSVADTLWLVADGKLQEFCGDLDDYQHWLRSRGKSSASTTGPSKTGAAEKKSGFSAPAEKPVPRRDPLLRLRRRLGEVAARIATLAAERALLEAELAANPTLDRIAMRRANLERDAAYLESQWMEIGTAIEAAEAKSQ
jgi:ATP-binding cassette, subfamily F, member 3